jgi:hypothetical protein
MAGMRNIRLPQGRVLTLENRAGSPSMRAFRQAMSAPEEPSLRPEIIAAKVLDRVPPFRYFFVISRFA